MGWKNGKQDVNIVDRTGLALDLDFVQPQGAPTTLSSPTVVDSNDITLTDTTGFVDGNQVLILGTGEFFIANQVGAPSGSTITLDSPADKILSIGTLVVRASRAMNVDGSVTPQTFQIGPIGSSIGVNITLISGYIQDGSVMDDSQFGGITALTNGVLLRKTDGTNNNLWNVKSNSDLAVICCGEFQYTSKAPAGSYGARFCNRYTGDSQGVAIKLTGSDMLEIIIQDDLTGLEEFRVIAKGYVL